MDTISIKKAIQLATSVILLSAGLGVIAAPPFRRRKVNTNQVQTTGRRMIYTEIFWPSLLALLMKGGTRPSR